MRLTRMLDCEVCQFDHNILYCEHGHGFAECHAMPISCIRLGGKTRVTDLAIVFANCPRMLHRGIHWPSVA